MNDKPWNVDRLIGEFNNWDCHQSDTCDCPHKYCDTYCSGKIEDQCQAEFNGDLEDEDVPGCDPDTCGQVQLDGLLAVVKALLELPGARKVAEEALRKHWGDEDALRIAKEQDTLIEQSVLWRCKCGTCCSVADDQVCPCGKSRSAYDPRPEDPAVLAKLVVAELQKHLIWAETSPVSVRKGEILVPYKSRTNARTIQAYTVADPRLAGMGVNAIAQAIINEQRADLAEWAQR